MALVRRHISDQPKTTILVHLFRQLTERSIGSLEIASHLTNTPMGKRFWKWCQNLECSCTPSHSKDLAQFCSFLHRGILLRASEASNLENKHYWWLQSNSLECMIGSLIKSQVLMFSWATTNLNFSRAIIVLFISSFCHNFYYFKVHTRNTICNLVWRLTRISHYRAGPNLIFNARRCQEETEGFHFWGFSAVF